MPRKLFGAALAARNKRLAKLRRRSNAKKASPARSRKRNPIVARKRRRSVKSIRRRNPRQRSLATEMGEMYGVAPRRRSTPATTTAATPSTTSRPRPRPASSSSRPRRRLSRSRRHAQRSYMAMRKRSLRARKRITGKGVRSLAKARHTIKYQRAHGSGSARKFLKAHKMRTNARKYRRTIRRRRNPEMAVTGAKSAVVSSLKAALPIAISLYASRALARKILPKIPGLDKLGTHAAPAGSLLMVLLGHVATKKVAKLGKYRNSIMIGLGLNAVDVLLHTYAPQSVKAMVGLGDNFDALQQATGEYVQTGEYIETGDYISVGAEEELGLEAEMGMLAEMGAEGVAIGSGIGTQSSSMLSPVASQAMVAPVPARSFTREIRGVGPDYDSNLASMYQGIFAGGF